MHFFFGDDSRQPRPTRERMGPLLAAGGVLVCASAVKSLEAELKRICSDSGFPPNDEFKWSPGREHWMRKHLVGNARRNFFFRVLTAAQDHDVKCIIVINDTDCNTATSVASHQEDVTRTLLERVHHRLPNDTVGCIVIVDRPSGDRSDEDRFLLGCLEHLQTGTTYVKHDKIALNVLSTPSKLVRILQLADLVTSCTTARVAGEDVYSPAVFSRILPLFAKEYGRIDGVSVKIHPDYKYANLYHWILGDSDFVRFDNGWLFPRADRPYSKNADHY